VGGEAARGSGPDGPAAREYAGRRRTSRGRAARFAALTAALFLATAGVGGRSGSGAAIPAPPPAGRPCALRAVPGVPMSEGFSADQGRGKEFARSTGTLRALTLLIDFPDAPAPESARRRYAEFFPAVARWYARASYGRLRYVSVPVLRWIRMPRPFASYGIGRGYGWDAHTAMMRDLLRAAGRRIDFRGYDLVNVLVTPNAGPPADQSVLSVTWTGASAATARDGAHLSRVSVIYGHDQAGYRVLAHENGHDLGLPDLYAAPDFARTDHLAGQWDTMSLDWGLGADLLAWHKWRLGWLRDPQIACFAPLVSARQSERTVDLAPLELPGPLGALKAVVIPYAPTRAYVLEARTRGGVDGSLCRTGVLIYRVRTDVPTGDGPVTVMDAQPRTPACAWSSAAFNSLNNAPFRPGQTFHAPDTPLTVRVLRRDTAGGWTVRITRGSR
jgi:M6 family metalloprotease-like protein